jgi:hypothetical protein
LEGQELTQKKSYSRYFIILQEDEKGYALASDKLPSGYAKLEIKNDKCKVSYYVQNLKKESAPYYMVLICNKKDAKKLLKLGELNIDEHGRADISQEYPVENVGNCSIGVDKIVGASIVRMMNSNIIPVMSGFTTTDIPDWKGFTLIEEDKKRQDEKIEDRMDKKVQSAQIEQPKAQPAEVAPAKVQPIEQQAPLEVPKQEKNIFDEYETKIEEVKEQKAVENVKPAAEKNENNMAPEQMMQQYDMDIEEEELRGKKKDKKCGCEEKHENECHNNENHKHEDECHSNENHKHEENCEHHKKCKENTPKGSVGSFFMDLADGYEELEGICSEIKRCKWYKVPVTCPEDMTHCMDYNKYTVALYPMMNYFQYIRRYEHFILGYKLDMESKMKYLVYGIPGTKSRMDQPFGGRTGFVTWVPLREGEEDENSFGYWLMFYDFRNSTIVIPVK